MASTHVSTVNLEDGREVCLSYGVPVAAFIPGRGYLHTDARYSVTTSRHMFAYVGRARGCRCTEVPDAELRTLILPVVGKAGRR